MNTLNISLIALSEWRTVHETGRIMERKEKQIKGQLAKLGKAAIITEHQIIIYESAVFEYNIAEPPRIYENGRLISITLQKQNNEHMTILCAYGVAGTDNNRRYKDGTTKGEIKKRLKEAASIERSRIYKEFGPTPLILIGDLQDGPEDRSNKKDSLYRWAIDKAGPNMRSYGYDNKGDAKYETYRSANGTS